ncbi:DnaB-like helicase C-terminal domain-containing protein [Sphingomonas sp. 4RDLI-65]
MPRNVEAEAALLGAMMIDNRIADEVVGRVEPAHFFEPLHARIFAAITGMRRRDMLVTPVTLRPMFEADEGIIALGGPSYLGALTGSGAGLIGARQFAQQIYDLASLRALIEVGRTLVERAMDTSEEINPRAQIEAAETLLASVAIGGSAAAPKPVGFAQAWDGAIRKAKAVANGTASRGAMIARFVEWNEITGGMSPGQLILLGGRPGMGKTAIALAVAVGAAAAGLGVLFISREMPVDQLMFRIIADMMFEAGSAVTLEDVMSGRLNEDDLVRAERIRARIDDWPLVFEEPPRLNAAQVAPLIRKHQRQLESKGHTLAITIVDYLGLLEPPVKRQNREQEMGDTSKELKMAARDTGTAVVALAQLNRGVESRDDKRPMLSDLRDSGSLEQDADTVVFAYRAEYYLKQTEPDVHDVRKRDAWEVEMGTERDRLDVYSAKVRQGATQRRKVYFFGARQAVRGVDYMREGGGASAWPV